MTDKGKIIAAQNKVITDLRAANAKLKAAESDPEDISEMHKALADPDMAEAYKALEVAKT